MKTCFFCGVGGVVSADIAVPEHERELDFYSKVLTTGNDPLWRKDLMNNLGTPVIGLGARVPEYDALPLQWMPHFQVADVGASAEAAIAMGGKELMHSRSDEGQSQWAVFIDPAGAGFGLIPAEESETGTEQPIQSIGCISWLSLSVPDALPSRDFYQQVVGWNGKAIESTDGATEKSGFEMQVDDEKAAAEILQANDKTGEIPAVWLIHLPVGDLAKSLELVNEGGGKVIRKFEDKNSALVRDPVGVYFAIQSSNA